MPSKEGWTHDRDHEKIQLGRKQYRNMEEWSRPCAVCGEKFSIFVRTNGGGQVNSSFGLRTCSEHRGEKPGVHGMPAPGELQALRTANATMKEELDGLYALNKELFDELQIAKAALATHGIVLQVAQQTAVDTTNSGLPKSFPWL